MSAAKEVKRTGRYRPRQTGARAAILKDRLVRESRHQQSIRLGVNYMTLWEAEKSDFWPRGAAGQLMRQALGLQGAAS